MNQRTPRLGHHYRSRQEPRTESETAMDTIHLPGDEPKPETTVGPELLPLVRAAALSDGALSPTLVRAVSAGVERRGPGRVAVAAFQSSV